MNATLTGLGILLVLALAAALFGPFFVDWNAFRADFEQQAQAQLGMPVTIGGDIDARILPMPYVRLNDVTVGVEGATRLRVRELQLRLGLTPLLRGRFEFNEVAMAAPRLDLTLDEHGWPVWSGGGPRPFDADRVAVGRVDVTDGSVVVTDLATGLRQHADDIRAVGEATSLQGPFKLEGTADIDDAPYSLQFNTGRLDGNGGLRAKLEVEAADRPLLIRADGTLQTGGERARYVGALVVQKPAPASKTEQGAPQGGNAAPEEPAAETWRVEGRVAADMRSVNMELFDFQYGPDERALKLTGSATVTLGAEPRFEANVAARQLDFDRAFRREGEQALTVRQVYDRLREAFPANAASSVPGHVGVEVGGAVLGGDIVQDVHTVLDIGPQGWSIAEGRARLPGSTALNLSGRVALAPAASFSGHADAEVGELAGLLHWLDGNEGARARTAIRSLKASGDITASAEGAAVENLSLQADRTSAEGRLRWTAATASGRARLEAALAARELRLDDAALGILSRLGGGGSDGIAGWLAATDLSLKLSAGALQLGGVEASQLSADLDVSGSAVDIRALSFRGPGDSQVAAKGWLSLDPGVSDGHLEADVAAARLDEVVRVAQQALGSTPALDGLAQRANALSPADLKLTLSRSATVLGAKLSGTAGGTVLDVTGETALAPETAIRGEGAFTNADAARLLQQIGVPVTTGGNAGEGKLSFDLSGANTGALRLSLEGAAAGFTLSGRGTMGLAGERLDGANIGFTIAGQNFGRLLALLGRGSAGAAATPAEIAGEIFYGDGQIIFANLDGKLGLDTVRGRVRLQGADWRQIGGQLAFDQLSGEALASLAFGPAALARGTAPVGVAHAWPEGPFTPPPLSALSGTVAVTADRFHLPGGLEARDASFDLGLRPDGLTIGSFKSMLARGRLTGNGSLLNDAGNGSLSAIVRLTDANLADLLPRVGTRPLATGTMGLSVDLQTTGRSLAAMAAALGGGGAFNIQSATVQGLDPAAFGKAVAAMEQGADVAAGPLVARMNADLFGAPLAVRSLEGAFTVASGGLRATGLSADAPGAQLTGDVAVDIANAALDASATLGLPPRTKGQTEPPVVVRLQGPLGAPVRSLDVTAFANFLGMRAVEIETRRIEQMEADIHERRMLNQRLHMMEVEKRWEAERKAEEARKADEQRKAAEAAAAEEKRKAEEAARAAEEERRRQEQVRIEEERARRLREAAPAAPGPTAPVPAAPAGAPRAEEPLPPLPTPIIVAPPPGARRSSLDAPETPPAGKPLNLMEFLGRPGGN